MDPMPAVRIMREALEPPGFYQPVERGLEIRIAQKLRELRARNDAAGAA